MPGEQEPADACVVNIAALDDLPPHRAAIPIPPAMLEEAFRTPKRFPWPSIIVALVLHCIFLAAAILWGQGGDALPPPERPVAVELVERAGARPAQEQRLAAAGLLPSAGMTQEQPIAPQEPAVSPPSIVAKEQPALPEPQPAAATQDTPVPAAADAPPVPAPAPAPTAAPERVPVEEDRIALKAREPEAQQPPPRPGRGPRTVERFWQMLTASAVPRRAAESSIPPLPVSPPLANRAAMVTAAMESRPPIIVAPRSMASTRGSARAIALANYQRRVRQRIQRKVPFGDFGAGEVAIGLVLSRSGRVLDAYILRSSGYPPMDRMALRVARSADPFPPPPPSAPPPYFLSIPFWFE